MVLLAPIGLFASARFGLGIYRFLIFCSTIGLLFVVPLMGLLCFFKRMRFFAGIAFAITGITIGLTQWFSCLIYALSVSVFWTISGICVAGVGVVPVSFVQMIGHKEWSILGQAILTILVAGLMRIGGFSLAAKYSETKTPEVDPVAEALRQAFNAASDACDAPFLAVDPYTTRSHYLSELSEAERERQRYDGPFYTAAYLEAHTVAVRNLMIAFDALTVAFKAWNPSARSFPSHVGVFEASADLYRITANAYHMAALYAACDAARCALQAKKDEIRAGEFEYTAANPSTTNPIEAKEKATAAKAKAAEDTANAEALRQKAEAAIATAQVLLEKAKAAEARADEALHAGA